ncbi:unnamed protein product [Periconia digitata]|uniref:Uncharacterized protein n=1 Tax=Periconia digitata TaxID=1303443 RepID=A0A9W4UV70_9PLEO|nr:unnamed protein product [Periconia digitata]
MCALTRRIFPISKTASELPRVALQLSAQRSLARRQITVEAIIGQMYGKNCASIG